MQCNFLGYWWNQCISILTICYFNIYKRQIWDYMIMMAKNLLSLMPGVDTINHIKQGVYILEISWKSPGILVMLLEFFRFKNLLEISWNFDLDKLRQIFLMYDWQKQGLSLIIFPSGQFFSVDNFKLSMRSGKFWIFDRGNFFLVNDFCDMWLRPK